MSTRQWIASIPSSEAVVLHALTRKLESKMMIDKDIIWLRGEVESEEALSNVNQLLKTVPGAGRFRLIADGRLQPLDHRLPTRLCPEGAWQSPNKLLSVELPLAGLAGSNSTLVPLRIVRKSSEFANSDQKPELLECDFDSFFKWATETSEARLEFLSFACSRDGFVVIHGQPLPHLVGISWIKYGQTAIPLGHSWQPLLSVKTLNQVVNPEPDTIHLLGPESHRVLHLTSFVKATRSSVRQTAIEIGGSHESV